MCHQLDDTTPRVVHVGDDAAKPDFTAFWRAKAISEIAAFEKLKRAPRHPRAAPWPSPIDELIDELRDHLKELEEHGCDCPPLAPLPKTPPEEVAAEVRRLRKRAPRALFPPNPPDGIQLKWPRSTRVVPASGSPGEAREPSPSLRLQQQGHQSTRRRIRRKGVRRSQ